MRNSAWYRKLWRKKLAELPLKEDAGSAWASMKNMLDTQMPVHGGASPGTHIAAKSLTAKITSSLFFALPAAAMISTVVYFSVPQHTGKKNTKSKKERRHFSADSLNHKQLQSAQADSDFLQISDLLKADSIKKIKIIEKAKAEGQMKEERGLQYGTASSYGANKSTIDTQDTATIGVKNVLARHQSSMFQKDNRTYALLLPAQLEPIEDKFFRKIKTKKTSFEPKKMTTPLFDYGLEAGLNKGNKNSFYFGIFGSYGLRTRWLLNGGLRIVTSEALSGSYTSSLIKSRPDTTQVLKVTDKRNIAVMTIPLTVSYRISNIISLNAGPLISFPIKQSGINYQFATLTNLKDTIPVIKQGVDSTLKHTTVNKINIGFTGGISIRIKQFYLDASYQQNLTPYKVSSDLGSYQSYNHSLQLGVHYKFKK
ncbi:outer membrane beta-barrel protein [Pedobacter sp. L105]|uniref:outer membrane beta-barrel protein n=1 Tax=Pedobacter sp. L105 TaxID=1641871 RepID=UPI00131E860D|nr:outer membrane beta-barrel protein [Pedobacter sp. L105]